MRTRYTEYEGDMKIEPPAREPSVLDASSFPVIFFFPVLPVVNIQVRANQRVSKVTMPMIMAKA